MSSRCPADRARRGLLPCLAASLSLIASLGAAGCQREERRFDDAFPPTGETASPLHPGGAGPSPPDASPYLGNAQAISTGKRLFEWYNCSGCHAHGGGDIGPALTDGVWLYGDSPENIYSAILEGRPNGMPSFRGKVNEQEAWQIVAFVQSLGGSAPFDVSASRDDHLFSSWSPIAR